MLQEENRLPLLVTPGFRKFTPDIVRGLIFLILGT